ncbi:MAG: hypothetical protein FJ312_03210 [SAR202 cluster bacterium]|nr:hypothetical protein [SAR202 cluster bacterium]
MKLQHLWWAALLLLLLVPIACGKKAEPTPTQVAAVPVSPTATPLPSPTPQPTATPVPPTPTFDPGKAILPTVSAATRTPTPVVSEFDRTLGEIETNVTTVRVLFSLRPVAKAFITREELGEKLIEDLEEERDEIEQQDALLTSLGVIGPDVSLHDLYLALYQEGVLGFYELKEEKLYVVQDGPSLGPQDVLTYAHEFVHALQQQHFDIQAGLDAREGQSDRQNAYRALVEGDATLAKSVYMFNHMTEEERTAAQQNATIDLEAFFAAPHLIQRLFVFPYIEGAQFVLSLARSEEGWAAVDAAFANPPESTEQILHPEKYAVREGPEDVVLPDIAAALGEGWTETGEDTLGEFLIMAYLETYLPEQAAAQAAGGWSGDTYAVLAGPGGQTAFVTVSVWDTFQDADEFGQALRDATIARTGTDAQWEGIPGETGTALLTLPDQVVMTDQNGQFVIAVFAPNRATLDAIKPLLVTAP